MTIMELVEKEQMKSEVPDFKAGDTVKVHAKVQEGEKQRIQVFEGVVICKKKGANRTSFTVRKISYGLGVERIFFFHSPMIDKVDIVTRGRVRRSRLYYLRKLKGKKARIREKR